MFDLIGFLNSALGQDAANYVAIFMASVTVASLLVKIGEVIAPFTPSLKDDNIVKKLSKLLALIINLSSIPKKN